MYRLADSYSVLIAQALACDSEDAWNCEQFLEELKISSSYLLAL